MIKIQNLKLVITSEFLNRKIFLLKDTWQIGLKFLLLVKLKIQFPWTYIINDLNGEEIIRSFYEKELQKTNQKEFRIEKVIKRKDDKLCVKWKGLMYHIYHIKMSQYFPKPFRSFGRNINVKVDLSNYSTKSDIKNISHVDTSNFALKTNLANLKSEVDKLDIDKLKHVPTDLSKLRNVVKNDVVKKMYMIN